MKNRRTPMLSENNLELNLVKEHDGLRQMAEEFAYHVYRKKYNAHIKTFCRELMVLRFNIQKVIACIGINTPESGELLLEQYLDMPVEKAISNYIKADVERDDIAEVGTLAISTNGICRLMMAGLVGYLKGCGKRFIVFTAVKSLRNTFTHLNIPYEYLADAVPQKLKCDAGEWGSYYDNTPQVIFVDLEMCWHQINIVLDNLTNNHSSDMEDLMRHLFIKGFLLNESFNAGLKPWPTLYNRDLL